jgi:hypothetical protein
MIDICGGDCGQLPGIGHAPGSSRLLIAIAIAGIHRPLPP